VEAFAYFGGVPARLVPDNLKTGVDKPDLYDPKINRSYAELAVHYDTLVDPEVVSIFVEVEVAVPHLRPAVR
jgi:transposase